MSTLGTSSTLTVIHFSLLARAYAHRLLLSARRNQNIVLDLGCGTKPDTSLMEVLDGCTYFGVDIHALDEDAASTRKLSIMRINEFYKVAREAKFSGSRTRMHHFRAEAIWPHFKLWKEKSVIYVVDFSGGTAAFLIVLEFLCIPAYPYPVHILPKHEAY